MSDSHVSQSGSVPGPILARVKESKNDKILKFRGNDKFINLSREIGTANPFDRDCLSAHSFSITFKYR